MNNSEGAWILAFIAMVGTVIAGMWKLIEKNGCRIKCWHANGNPCCDTDCDEGRQPQSSKIKKSDTDSSSDSL